MIQGEAFLKRLLTVLTAVILLFGGCTRTVREQKATETDPGNITQVKFTGNKLKLVHDF